MGLLLVILGLVLWFGAGYFLVGLILVILGLAFFFYPGSYYGYGHWRGPRGP